MNAYLIVKAIHVVAVAALVGPLFLAPRWLSLSSDIAGQRVLNDLHAQTAIAGWIVLISGAGVLYVQNGAFLDSPWMQMSIAVYLLVQVFDHFWADKREEELANGSSTAVRSLHMWLVMKIALYLAISLVMVLKPLP